MLFIFLNFNIELGASRVGLIPDFVGYLFMARGLTELLPLSDRFQRIRPYVKGIAVYSGLCYAADLLGISTSMELFLLLILGLISMILALYISYSIISGIKDIELTKRQDLGAARLYRVWRIMAVFTVLSYFLCLIPILFVACIVAGLAVGIYYLFVFYKTKQLYYEQNIL